MKDDKNGTFGGKRPGWDEYFINIAGAVALRATCHRRRYGAVITRNNSIVSTGYNGAPSGMQDCLEAGKCTRKELDIPHGQRYELCHSVHAEANAISKVASSTQSCNGSTLYITMSPCRECSKLIHQAGIVRVVYQEQYKDGEGIGFLERAGVKVKMIENLD